MRNPFRYGEIASGSSFTNRSKELAELTADIRNGQNVVIISPRRYGKTSLVFQAIGALKPEHILVAYVDLFRTPTKKQLADHLAGAIYGGIVAPVERVMHRAIDVFQKLPIRPKINIEPDGTPSFEFSVGEETGDLDKSIEELLELVGKVAKSRRRIVVLVMDEFQEIMSIDPRLPALLRSVFQFQSEVSHIFLGSKHHLMRRVFTVQNEPMYKMAKMIELHEISHNDFARFIKERFDATNRQIAGEVVDRLLDITGGHPHDTQELCYFTWSLTDEGKEASIETVDQALEQVLDAENAHYTILWEGLNKKERLLVTALVKAGSSSEIYSEEFRNQYELGGPPSSLQKPVRSLVERGLIEVHNGLYQVPDVFFRAWTKRLIGTVR